MKELLVIIPAYNEEMNITGVVNEIMKDIPEADIVVINDCSTDRTSEILKEKGIPDKNGNSFFLHNRMIRFEIFVKAGFISKSCGSFSFLFLIPCLLQSHWLYRMF